MERPFQHILEDESRRAFTRLIPPAWIVRDKYPDYGIDMEVEIVEEGKVSSDALWIQLKATKGGKSPSKPIALQIDTKLLKYIEGCRLPVAIILWIKAPHTFYYLFGQKYIRETLSKKNTNWREQKKATIYFSDELNSSNLEELKSIASKGYIELFQYLIQDLNAGSGPNSAYYWVDGIPKSDKREIKERTAEALMCIKRGEYKTGVTELEAILRECTPSPLEKMGILINLGNAYLLTSQNDKALQEYNAVISLVDKVEEKKGLEAKAAALGNMGLLYFQWGKTETAIEHFEKAQEIDNILGLKEGMANNLGNLGLVYFETGNWNKALKYHQKALEVSREIKNQEGISSDLGNIGLIYAERGESEKALEYSSESLKISREIGFKVGEARQLCNIGSLYAKKGEFDKALEYYHEAYKIDTDVGDKIGEGNGFGNLGEVYVSKGDLDKALFYFNEALKVHKEISYKIGEGAQLVNIGVVYSQKGEDDKALEFFEEALKVHREIGSKQGEASDLINIAGLYPEKIDQNKALQYLEEAKEIHSEIGFKEGEAFALGGIGSIYLKIGDLTKAHNYLEKSLNIFKEIDLKQGIANATGTIGLVYKAMKEYDKALEASEKARQIYVDIGNKQGIGHQIGNIGLLYANKGDLDKALEYQTQSIEIFKEVKSPQLIVQALCNISFIYLRKGESETAFHTLGEAFASSITNSQRQTSFNALLIMINNIVTKQDWGNLENIKNAYKIKGISDVYYLNFCRAIEEYALYKETKEAPHFKGYQIIRESLGVVLNKVIDDLFGERS